MKPARDLGIGLIAVIISSLLVFGAFAISIAEGMPAYLPSLETTNTTGTLITVDESSTSERTQSTGNETIHLQTRSPTSCTLPPNWISYTVQEGDTLITISQKYSISIESLKKSNCFESDSLLPGTVIFVPRLIETPTPSPSGNISRMESTPSLTSTQSGTNTVTGNPLEEITTTLTPTKLQ